jgi:hypothetical protein
MEDCHKYDKPAAYRDPFYDAMPKQRDGLRIYLFSIHHDIFLLFRSRRATQNRAISNSPNLLRLLFAPKKKFVALAARE